GIRDFHVTGVQTCALPIYLKIVITLLTVIGGAVAAGCGTSANSAETGANNAPVSVQVTTAQAEIRPIPSYIEATGNLASDEQTRSEERRVGKAAGWSVTT